MEESKMAISNKSEHVVSLNMVPDGEAIGSIDMLDGDTGKTYSLGVFDGGNRDNLYVCPLDPMVDMEERDVTYMKDLLSPDVYENVRNAYDNLDFDSMILHNDDLKMDKSELVQNERFANWSERIENGDMNFSEKEMSLYQEMTNEGFPKLDALEARIGNKDNDISMDSAEKIISDYVGQMNEEKPLVHSKTDNQLREQYQLLSTEKDGDMLKMKYLDRNDSGFSSKTFAYNQESGMVTEMDTTMVRGHDNLIGPETTVVDSININEMKSQINTQSITEEKTITRITREEGIER